MWRRGKSTGWAAVDLKQQKKGSKLSDEKEHFPPIPSTAQSVSPCKNHVKNNGSSTKSFSSVLLPSASSSCGMPVKDKSSEVGISCAKSQFTKFNEHDNNVTEVNQTYKKLLELYPWADRSLVEDVMAAANNDADEASTLLKSMTSSESIEGSEGKHGELNYEAEDFILSNKNSIDNHISLDKQFSPAKLSSALDDKCSDKKLLDKDSYMKMNLGDSLDLKLILDKIGFVPAEPEWEEEDIYSIHRRDAIKIMRSAAKHSKAATDAYLKGDHLSAQQIAQHAREEWVAAGRLNAKAAKEILCFRNRNNDMWKLDLHGLHATEAVIALQDHLHRIESRKLNSKASIACPESFETLNYINLEMLDKEMARPRSSLLEVITGRGNHSRGQATLPTTIRGFLDQNGYRYEETRPGVIIVRPKFHHR